jgi:hypothetical protein
MVKPISPSVNANAFVHLQTSLPQDLSGGCCQTNANRSRFSSGLNLLGCAEVAPLGESGSTVQLEI